MNIDGAGQGQATTAAISNNVRNSVKETGNSYFLVSSSSSAADAAEGLATRQGTASDVFQTGSGNRQVRLDPKKVTNFGGVLNGLGAAFSGLAAYSVIDNYASGKGNFADAIKGVYYSLGTFKEASELMAVFITRGWLNKLGAGPKLQNVATSVLAGSNKEAGGLPICRRISRSSRAG
jgi:hypothetical protein